MSTQTNNYPKRSGGNIFWGIIFIAAATLILLSTFGFLEDIKLTTIFFGVLFVATGIRSLIKRSIPGTIFSIAFLTIILGRQFHIQELKAPHILLAAFLLSAGLSMICHNRRHTSFMAKNAAEKYHSDGGVETENTFFCNNTLGSSTKYVNASNLQMATIRNSFGETTVYFDNAHLSENGAKILLQNSFGETTLYIPAEWNVTTDISCSFGDLKIPPETITEDAPNLHISGNVSFGECIIQRM